MFGWSSGRTLPSASRFVMTAMWPGLVGKGPDSEPPISLEQMLDLTCGASVDGVKFDGVDLFLASPHTDIDSTDDDLKKLADDIGGRGLVVGSMVAPVWGPTGGGSAMGIVKCDQSVSSRRSAARARAWR